MALPIAGLLTLGGKLIDRLIPDKEARDRAKLELMKMDEEGELSRMQTQAGIITAEAQGGSWLQRNWRPLMMVWFGILVGMYWFGVTPENLSEAALADLFQLIQLGIGGYIVGRSAEKVTKVWKESAG
jgi:hypothetical protein